MRKMTNPLRRQIEEMEPRRYARAAKRAAEAAESSALKEGIEVSDRIRHLLDTSEDELAEEQRERLGAGRELAPQRGRSGGGDLGSSVDLVANVELEASDDASSWLLPVTSADWTAAARTALQTLPSNWPSTTYSAAKAAVRKLSPTIGSSPTSAWLHDRLNRDGSAYVEANVGGLLKGRRLPLEKGEVVMSADGAWQVHWREDGDLLVVVKGDDPWSTPVADDDVITVDPAFGTIVVEGASPRSQSVWQQNLLDAEHGQIGRRGTNRVMAIRITSHDRSPAPTVIALPMWQRLMESSVVPERGINVEDDGPRRALLDADLER
jgi:hypothetical protein